MTPSSFHHLWLLLLLLCYLSPSHVAIVNGHDQYQCQCSGGAGQYQNHDGVMDFNSNAVVDLTFITDGSQSFVRYTDAHYGNLKVQVPRFFFDFSRERLLREIHYSIQNPSWSERVLLEIFYYAVTYGTDHRPTNSSCTTATTSQRTSHCSEDNNDDDDDENNAGSSGIGLEGAEHWLSERVDICQWEGILCGPLLSNGGVMDDQVNPPLDNGKSMSKTTTTAAADNDNDNSHYQPPCQSVTSIDFMEKQLHGTLPPQLSHLKHLHRLNLNDNGLHGSIPTTYGNFEHLRFLDLGENNLTGLIPLELGNLGPTLQELWLEKNALEGPLDYVFLMQLSNCRFIDLSSNKLTGTIPVDIGLLTSLNSLFLEENHLTGTIVSEFGLLEKLRVLDLGVNELTGEIPFEIGDCTSLIDLNVGSNRLNGSLPLEIFYLTNLEVLVLSENELTGRIPEGDNIVPSRVSDLRDDDDEDDAYGYSWSDFQNLVALAIDRNNFIGPFPAQLFYGLAPSLTNLDIGYNFFTGTLAPEIGKMTHLKRFSAPFNFFMGSIPFEIGRMKELWSLNLTSNIFTGSIPKALCKDQFMDPLMAEEFGCDAMLCPPGTFQPSGAANVVGGCQPCPKTILAEEFLPPLSTVLGRSSCESARYLYGDADVDGTISARETLRYLYFETNGEVWGDKYYSWRDMKVDECELTGITCRNGEVTGIDLSEANLCGDGKDRSLMGIADSCSGLPGILMYLNQTLESFYAPHRRFLRGTLPTELGALTKLRVLDLQDSLLSGTIPTELGLLTNMQQLDLSGARLNGTIPTELFSMTSLEKINLSLNPFLGTLPSEAGRLKKVTEFRISRAYLNGTLPPSLGSLEQVENLEIYGNQFTGGIPVELGKLTALKRIDLFNNRLTGAIPDELGNAQNLQILHFKKNQLSGEIPASIGELPYLVWFDGSLNLLSGTIPPSFGTAPMLKDLRIHGNRLFDPIPPSLCSNPRLNGGNTVAHGCDAIVCPIGTFSPSNDYGFAHDSVVCEKCPGGQTTLYLGSTECIELDQSDLLAMLYDVLDGDTWPDEFKKGWKEENTSVCDWAGVTCNEKEEIIGLSIPRSETD